MIDYWPARTSFERALELTLAGLIFVFLLPWSLAFVVAWAFYHALGEITRPHRA